MRQCVHCKNHVSWIEARGLCPPCYRNIDIRHSTPLALPPNPHTHQCRHCKAPYTINVHKGSRGLCTKCYRNLAIRLAYPALRPGGGKRPEDTTTAPQVAPTAYAPTHHLPGTVGKLKVLCERAARGLPLWHPLDATGKGLHEQMAVSELVDLAKLDEVLDDSAA